MDTLFGKYKVPRKKAEYLGDFCMKKILLVPLLSIPIFLGSCNLVVPTPKYEALQAENAALQSQMEQLNQQVGELEAQNTALQEKITERRENEVTDPFDEKVLGSLFLRPDLIPVGGESMRYYTDLCRVLGEQYVYAYAEDGRNTADMILSYAPRTDGGYDWTLETYDSGHGWQIPAGVGATDTTGTVPAPLERPEEPSGDASVPQVKDPDGDESKAEEPGGTASGPADAPAPPPKQGNASSVPGLNVPVPNEAQQQKFRDIASLVG